MTTDRLGVLVSRADEASVRIGEQLRSIADWQETVDDGRPDADGGGTVYRRPGIELRTIEERHLETVGVAEIFDDPRMIAIASRHSGDTGPLLTAHHTGNFGPADHGGQARNLARAAPNAHREVLLAFAEHAPEGYDVGMECTHHGPSDVGAPSLFVEVGSGPEQWRDPAAAAAVARSIFDLVDVPADVPRDESCERESRELAAAAPRRHLVGFGGGHYAPRFERIVRDTDWAVGHVAADWSLDALGDPAKASALVDAAFVESAAEYALVTAESPSLVETIEELGYRVVGETWVRETSGVPLPAVETLEAAVGPVDDGLRFGTLAVEWDGDDAATGAIPEGLLAAVNAVDREGALEAATDVALAYDTENNGSRLAGSVALADRSDEDELLAEFVAILREDYDDVDRGDDEIVARRREFDPDLAREAGVAPGPDFGRLSAGEPVTVDGETVTPDQVTVARERRFDATMTSS